MDSTPNPIEDAATPDDVPAPPASAPLPVTGHPAIDHALAEVTLGEDVHTHHDQLAEALEVVQGVLNRGSQPPLPGR